MVQRADSHDDVYDRQIRLWGADAQVSSNNVICVIADGLCGCWFHCIVDEDVLHSMMIKFPLSKLHFSRRSLW